jgi:hypothetical protein
MQSLGEHLVEALLPCSSRREEGLSSSLLLQEKINQLQRAHQLEKWITQQQLPPLTGSVYQIRWAQAIRVKILKRIITRLMRSEQDTLDPDGLAQRIDELFSHTTASFWITQNQEAVKKIFSKQS